MMSLGIPASAVSAFQPIADTTSTGPLLDPARAVFDRAHPRPAHSDSVNQIAENPASRRARDEGGTHALQGGIRYRGCCQSNRNLSLVSTALPVPTILQAMRDCHSATAAERRSLYVCRSTRWRSELKWWCILAWTEANFWSVFFRLKRCITRSLRLNGKCEFSTRLLAQRPISCFS